MSNKTLTLNELYNIAHKIPKNISMHNKYTFIAYNNIIDVRYLDINDALTKQIPINNYIKERGVILLFPTIINDVVTNIFIRALDKKDYPLKLGKGVMPFGVHYFTKDFKYGDPIILVEGIADLAGLKLINQNINVVAMQSNGLSRNAAQILTKMTNNFIILPDADSSGNLGANKTRWALRKLGADVHIVKQYSSLKDTGDFVDLVMSYMSNPDETLASRISLIKEYYTYQLKVKQ